MKKTNRKKCFLSLMVCAIFILYRIMRYGHRADNINSLFLFVFKYIEKGYKGFIFQDCMDILFWNLLIIVTFGNFVQEILFTNKELVFIRERNRKHILRKSIRSICLSCFVYSILAIFFLHITGFIYGYKGAFEIRGVFETAGFILYNLYIAVMANILSVLVDFKMADAITLIVNFSGIFLIDKYSIICIPAGLVLEGAFVELKDMLFCIIITMAYIILMTVMCCKILNWKEII